MLALGVAFLAVGRSGPVPSRAHATPAASNAVASARTSAAVPVPLAAATILLRTPVVDVPSRALVLPPGVPDVELSVMPDRFVNEPPPASFRLLVIIRGIPGLASVEGPASVTWTEDGLSYRLASPVRTLAQLIDLASALR